MPYKYSSLKFLQICRFFINFEIYKYVVAFAATSTILPMNFVMLLFAKILYHKNFSLQCDDSNYLCPSGILFNDNATSMYIPSCSIPTCTIYYNRSMNKHNYDSPYSNLNFRPFYVNTFSCKRNTY